MYSLFAGCLPALHETYEMYELSVAPSLQQAQTRFASELRHGGGQKVEITT
jgi:hypothetical protein